MNAADRFNLFVELGPSPKGSCISQPDPKVSDVSEDLATCWIVRGSQSALALGSPFPWIYLKHWRLLLIGTQHEISIEIGTPRPTLAVILSGGR
jgi:hypothetical protein